MSGVRYSVVIVLFFISLLCGQEEIPKCYENQKWYVKIPATCPQNQEKTDCLYLFDKSQQKNLYGILQNTKQPFFVDSTNPLITYTIALDTNILTQNKKTKKSQKIEEEHYLLEPTPCAYIDGVGFSREWEDIITATAQQKDTTFYIQKLDTATLRFIAQIGESPNQKTSSAEFILKPLSNTQAHIIYTQNTLCKILITKREDILLIGQFESKGVCESLYESELSPLATQYQFDTQTQKQETPPRQNAIK